MRSLKSTSFYTDYENNTEDISFCIASYQRTRGAAEQAFRMYPVCIQLFSEGTKIQYQQTKKSDNYRKRAARLTQLKKQEETEWLGEVNSRTLQGLLRNLDTAFDNFFCGHAEFPRFQNKRKKNSFTVPQFVEVGDGKVHFPKFKEGIKLIEHRELKGEVRRCTISKTFTGKFFVAILCRVAHEPLKPAHRAVGIDLGLKDFAVTSDGIRFANSHHLKRHEKELAKAQRHLSRKAKGSNGRNRQRIKVAALYEKSVHTRLDQLHKISVQIINGYDIICLEDLNVKGMMSNQKLAKHIGDAGWGTFVRLLEYKAIWNDKRVVKVNRFYPSSKTCHICGYINHELTLSDRTWICLNGHMLDRDINASINLLIEGL